MNEIERVKEKALLAEEEGLAALYGKKVAKLLVEYAGDELGKVLDTTIDMIGKVAQAQLSKVLATEVRKGTTIQNLIQRGIVCDSASGSLDEE